MARTLSSAAQTALAARVTRPVQLVEIGWSPVVRLSTNGDVSWTGYTWSGASRVEVDGISQDAGRLVIGNSDTAFGAQCLLDGVADVTVRIWAGDAAATAADDMALIFDGVGDSCEITDEAVTITLAGLGTRVLMAPRHRINAAAGFATLLAAGQDVTIGGQIYRLERR